MSGTTDNAPSTASAAGSTRPVVSVPDARWLDLWSGRPAPVEVRLWDLTGPVPPGVEVVVLPYMGGVEHYPQLARVPGLRVVQTLTAGYEAVLAFVPPGVVLANAAGVHDASTAELAVGLAISALRGIGDFARAQTTGQWLAGTRPALADRRVLLLGAGQVAGAIAARLAPFEVELTRVARTARTDAQGVVHGIQELPALLPHHDVVIAAVPLTQSTRHLIDADFLAAMPPGALLVNVARGPVVDTDALVAALAGGDLLAALDVTDPEPLPAEHPLWRSPNVLISPHVGGDSTAFPPRAAALLREQFSRYVAGLPLLHVVCGGPGDTVAGAAEPDRR